jgi:hypothetical protein
LGREIVVGYGTCLIPIGDGRREIKVELMTPKPSSWWTGFMGLVTSSPPALVDPGKFFVSSSDPSRTKDVCMQPAGGSIELLFYTSVEVGEGCGLLFT